MDSKKRLKTWVPGKEKKKRRKSEKELRKKPNFEYAERVAGIIVIKKYFNPYFLSQEI